MFNTNLLQSFHILKGIKYALEKGYVTKRATLRIDSKLIYTIMTNMGNHIINQFTSESLNKRNTPDKYFISIKLGSHVSEERRSQIEDSIAQLGFSSSTFNNNIKIVKRWALRYLYQVYVTGLSYNEVCDRIKKYSFYDLLKQYEALSEFLSELHNNGELIIE